jgi:hypothetical protein
MNREHIAWLIGDCAKFETGQQNATIRKSERPLSHQIAEVDLSEHANDNARP